MEVTQWSSIAPSIAPSLIGFICDLSSVLKTSMNFTHSKHTFLAVSPVNLKPNKTHYIYLLYTLH